jgi:hypothetical protein
VIKAVQNTINVVKCIQDVDVTVLPEIAFWLRLGFYRTSLSFYLKEKSVDRKETFIID